MWPYLGPIRTYAIAYLAGILAHFVIAFLIARRFRLRWHIPLLISVSYLLGMTVGAKALFDIQAGAFSFGALVSAAHYEEGGMWGGPLAYLCLAVPLVLALCTDRRAGLDLTALALPIPMMIAKIGCLSHGCCHGKPTSLPWGVTFPTGEGPAPADVPLHPTQIYEIIVLGLAAVILHRINQPRCRGMLLFWFLALYGLGRPLTEVFRGDLAPRTLWGPFTQSQWLCGAASAAAICILILHHRRASRRPPLSAVPAD